MACAMPRNQIITMHACMNCRKCEDHRVVFSHVSWPYHQFHLYETLQTEALLFWCLRRNAEVGGEIFYDGTKSYFAKHSSFENI
jgi:hypothetical protein